MIQIYPHYVLLKSWKYFSSLENYPFHIFKYCGFCLTNAIFNYTSSSILLWSNGVYYSSEWPQSAIIFPRASYSTILSFFKCTSLHVPKFIHRLSHSILPICPKDKTILEGTHTLTLYWLPSEFWHSDTMDHWWHSDLAPGTATPPCPPHTHSAQGHEQKRNGYSESKQCVQVLEQAGGKPRIPPSQKARRGHTQQDLARPCSMLDTLLTLTPTVTNDNLPRWPFSLYNIFWGAKWS